MIGSESITIALRGIMANRLRSALTMLGILIGVGSVIVLVAVGNGSAQAVQSRIESLGTNTLIVFRTRAGFGRAGATTGTQSTRSQLTAADVSALSDKTQAPDIKSVSPTITATVTATWQGNTYSPSSFIGTTPGYEEARSYQTDDRHVLHPERHQPAQQSGRGRPDRHHRPLRRPEPARPGRCSSTARPSPSSAP